MVRNIFYLICLFSEISSQFHVWSTSNNSWLYFIEKILKIQHFSLFLIWLSKISLDFYNFLEMLEAKEVQWYAKFIYLSRISPLNISTRNFYFSSLCHKSKFIPKRIIKKTFNGFLDRVHFKKIKQGNRELPNTQLTISLTFKFWRSII